MGLITVKVKHKFTWEAGRGYGAGDITQLPEHAVKVFEEMDPPAVERIGQMKETNLQIGAHLHNVPPGGRMVVKLPERS